jgi:fructose/tagatose bisphosphate aldolase
MPLSTNKELLKLARREGYAVGAFNINNMEILQAIVAAAEAERSPAIIAVSEGAIQKAIPLGISKINIDTDLRLSFVGAIREILATKPEEFDPRKILGPGREAIKQTVQGKMKLFGSSGKAVV